MPITPYLYSKVCSNPRCRRPFTTEFPSREYCHIRCRDYAAQLRRRQRDQLTQTAGFDPTAGEKQRAGLAQVRAMIHSPEQVKLDAEILVKEIKAGRASLDMAHSEVVRKLASDLLGVIPLDSTPPPSDPIQSFQDANEAVLHELFPPGKSDPGTTPGATAGPVDGIAPTSTPGHRPTAPTPSDPNPAPSGPPDQKPPTAR